MRRLLLALTELLFLTSATLADPAQDAFRDQMFRAQDELRGNAAAAAQASGKVNAEAYKKRVEELVAKTEWREWVTLKAKSTFKAKYLHSGENHKVVLYLLMPDDSPIDMSRVQSYNIGMFSKDDQTFINTQIKAEREAVKKAQEEQKKANAAAKKAQEEKASAVAAANRKADKGKKATTDKTKER